jgi:hypothetical protein
MKKIKFFTLALLLITSFSFSTLSFANDSKKESIKIPSSAEVVKDIKESKAIKFKNPELREEAYLIYKQETMIIDNIHGILRANPKLNGKQILNTFGKVCQLKPELHKKYEDAVDNYKLDGYQLHSALKIYATHLSKLVNKKIKPSISKEKEIENKLATLVKLK